LNKVLAPAELQKLHIFLLNFENKMDKVTLYGLNKAGGFKVWSIWTENDRIILEHGKLDGKLQKKIEAVKGKNIGRANETTPAEQAEFEAKSKINKQKDKGYREDKDSLESLPLLPMLAQDYLKQGHRIKYPCYESGKLDGVRCLAICDEDGVILKSRGGKLYAVKHIIEELNSKMVSGDIWDGELYIHGKYLEEIVSAVKKPNEMTKDIKFVVFDIVTDDKFVERLTQMDYLQLTGDWNSRITSPIEFLNYDIVKNEEEMKLAHKRHVSNGLEGVMLRNFDGEYESGKRSADLQKYKEFLDEEFPIVGVKEDKNGNAVFEVYDCLADANFTVTYGDFDKRKEQLANPHLFIGKPLTVKFQTRYKDSKLPQFPVGVSIRDYE
jgi:DNA ligase-1